MKNLFRISILCFVVASMASCYSGTPKGKTDSVATTSVDTGASTTVDTLATPLDSAKTDSTKR